MCDSMRAISRASPCTRKSRQFPRCQAPASKTPQRLYLCQHQKFQQVVLGKMQPEVTLSDGLIAVQMGMAAQEFASQSRIIHFSTSDKIAKSPKAAINPV